MTTAAPVSLDDMIAEVDRELGQRARVYPYMIERGKLTPIAAESQNARLRAIRAQLIQDREAGRTGGAPPPHPSAFLAATTDHLCVGCGKHTGWAQRTTVFQCETCIRGGAQR